MKVIWNRLLNEPVLIASLVVAVGAYFETTVAGALAVIVGGVLLRTQTSPAREVEEVPVDEGNPSLDDLGVEVDRA